MTKPKLFYTLLAFCVVLALFIGLRHYLQPIWNPTSATASSRDNPMGAGDDATAFDESQPLTTTSDNAGQPATVGGTFVQIVARDADTLNPLLTTNPTSRAVFQKIYPALIDQDPASGMPTVGRGLAAQWEFADGGRTIRFTLRGDIRWSDGTPVLARDVKFTYDAIRDPATKSVYRLNFAKVSAVETVPDDERVLILRLTEADCALLQALNQPILPSHLFQGWSAEQLADPNLRPQVSAGPFQLIDWIPGRRITLVRNAGYWEGAPRLERWELHIIPDPIVQLQAMIDGAGDWLELEPGQVSQAKAQPGLQIYSALADSLTFVALNLANSGQPQPGRNADGTLLAQEPHPILGDRRMRLALAQAIDYERLLREVGGATLQPLPAYLLPIIPWAYAADLPTPAYDPAQAQRLLNELAWRDSDGDGVRDRGGVPLSLSLLTNSDNDLRTQLAWQLAQQWEASGIDIRFEQQPFDAIADRLLRQQYDMVLIGWDNLGPEPANSDFWHSRYDAPGDGANFVSYQNPQVDEWLDQARTNPTCDTAGRGKLYRQVQQQIAQDLPYILISGQVKQWAYPTTWQELTPYPWRFDYNSHRWWKP
jgi:peptide/nickel transport system substrate-binding protein